MPKVELHVHIEGTLEPELAFELAARNDVPLPYGSPDEMRAAYEFGDLQSFLDVYYAASAVLVESRDFRDLAWAYLERATVDNAVHAEIFFDPQTHLARGVSLGSMIAGLTDALRAGREHLGVSSRLIMSFLRDLPEKDALETLGRTGPYISAIDGIGLDSTEIGNPPRKFTRLFEAARRIGLGAVAHAGEEGPPDYIRDSLDLLHVSRIDHGVRAIEDPELVTRLAREQITLTVCPLSNVRLKVYESLEEHPIRRMLDAGLAVTVNSDDPAYFGGYITDNYLAVHRALGIDRGDLYRLAANAIAGAWLPDERKSELTSELVLAFA